MGHLAEDVLISKQCLKAEDIKGLLSAEFCFFFLKNVLNTLFEYQGRKSRALTERACEGSGNLGCSGVLKV